MDFVQHILERGLVGGLERLFAYAVIALLGAFGAYFLVRLGWLLVRRRLLRKAARIAAVPSALVNKAWSAATDATAQAGALVANHYTRTADAIAPFANQAADQISSTASRVGTIAGDAVETVKPVVWALAGKAGATAENAVELARDGIG